MTVDPERAEALAQLGMHEPLPATVTRRYTASRRRDALPEFEREAHLYSVLGYRVTAQVWAPDRRDWMDLLVGILMMILFVVLFVLVCSSMARAGGSLTVTYTLGR
jgi:hypothetical protein